MGAPATSRATTRATAHALPPGRFYGHVLRRRTGAGLTISELLHERPFRPPRHTHQLAYFSLLLAGDYRETAGRGTIEHGQGTVVFHPAGDVHEDEVGPRGGRFLTVELDNRWAPERPLRTRGVTVERRGALCWGGVRLLRALRRPTERDELAIEELVAEMVATVDERPRAPATPPPRWLWQATERLRAEVTHPPGLAELAASAGVHPSHLARSFRRWRGRSLRSQVHAWRVQWLSEQLAGTDRPLAELALEIGFADQSHCTRVFGRHTGSPPAAFRRAFR